MALVHSRHLRLKKGIPGIPVNCIIGGWPPYTSKKRYTSYTSQGRWCIAVICVWKKVYLVHGISVNSIIDEWPPYTPEKEIPGIPVNGSNISQATFDRACTKPTGKWLIQSRSRV